MAYQRKTKDWYQLLGDYGQGLEVILEEETYKEAKQRKKEYLENDSQVSNLQIKLKREKIEK